MNCPHRLRYRVNQVVTISKPESSAIEPSRNNLSNPTLANKFEVLSHLDEEVN